ncbi:MAG TPA: phenylacetate--CoA ligase family protein, partial [Bacillota bacterium]|nr:phenylacetate--CoA ligase family protein [Bacillota bacterium]
MALNLSKHEPFSLDRIFYYQEQMLRKLVPHLYKNSPFYRKKLDEAGVAPESVKSLDDLGRLPFTTKEELREGYPLGLMAAPEERVVRIHS